MRTALLIFVVAVSASEAAAQTLVDRRIEVGTTTIRFRCGGQRRAGAPLVVLEAGAFNTVDTWRDVQARVAASARVCAHDRPGRGQSGPAPAGLDGRGYVALLADALRAAGEAPPYVLVGHSLGGLIAQLFVALRPSLVSGVVLLDSSHPDQVRRMADVPSPPAPAAPRVRPSPEAVSLDAFAAALDHAAPPIGVPLAVVTRSRWTGAADSAADLARLARWQELQRELASRSASARHDVAPASGHYVQNDAPGLVVEAVRWVLDRTSKP